MEGETAAAESLGMVHASVRAFPVRTIMPAYNIP
jgi:hypothetical protein